MLDRLTLKITAYPRPWDTQLAFNNKRAWLYLPTQAKEYQYWLRSCIQKKLPENFEPYACPVWLRLSFVFPREDTQVTDQLNWHIRDPDLTNLVKLAEDATKQLILKDDRYVTVSGPHLKVISSTEKTGYILIHIQPLENVQNYEDLSALLHKMYSTALSDLSKPI